MQLLGPDCDDRCKVGTFSLLLTVFPANVNGVRRTFSCPGGLDSAPMDRRLARRNLRTALITSVIGLLMFALTFVAALLYVA
jgi:predicted secreted protein